MRQHMFQVGGVTWKIGNFGFFTSWSTGTTDPFPSPLWNCVWTASKSIQPSQFLCAGEGNLETWKSVKLEIFFQFQDFQVSTYYPVPNSCKNLGKLAAHLTSRAQLPVRNPESWKPVKIETWKVVNLESWKNWKVGKLESWKTWKTRSSSQPKEFFCTHGETWKPDRCSQPSRIFNRGAG